MQVTAADDYGAVLGSLLRVSCIIETLKGGGLPWKHLPLDKGALWANQMITPRNFDSDCL